MPHAKFQDPRTSGPGEEFERFWLFKELAAIMVM